MCKILHDHSRVPMCFRMEYALKALNGDLDAIDAAFQWASTPQGYVFWSQQCKHGLTSEGRFLINAWMMNVQRGDEF